METAEISTPATDVQGTDTSLEVTPAENADTVTDEPAEQENAAETESEENKEPEKLYAGKYKTVEELEKGYKESEKSFNRVAELEKEIETLRNQVPQQPQIVNEQGVVNPQFEQAFYFNLNQGELREYQNLAMQLEDEGDRNAAIQQLNQANAYLSNGNIQGFNACMNEAKMLFNPAHIERINGLKMQALANKNATINQAMQQQRMRAGANLEAKLQTNEAIWKLVNPDSPDYNQGVFNAVCDYFNSYGDVDVDELVGIMNTFKEIGVKEYQANLEAQKTAAMNKSKASIASGENIDLSSDTLPTYEQISKMSQEEYNRAYKKFGDKLLTAQ